MERSDDAVAGMNVHEKIPDEVMRELADLKIEKPKHAPETREMEQAVPKLRRDWQQEKEPQQPKGKATWDWLNNDVKEIISAKILSEKGRTRTLKFFFVSFLHDGNKLYQVLTRDLKNLITHCHTKRALMPILPDHKWRVHKTFRLLIQSVFKLLPNQKPRDDAVQDIHFDTINLSQREWRMVPLLLRRYKYIHTGGRNFVYRVEFEEPAEIDVDVNQKRRPNKFIVDLYHWHAPVSQVNLKIFYQGPMRFAQTRTPEGMVHMGGMLVDKTTMSDEDFDRLYQTYERQFNPAPEDSDED